MTIRIGVLFIVFLFQFAAYAQVDSIGQTIDTLNSTSIEDLSQSKKKVKNDSIVGFFSIFKGEPGKAALYSLLIPGGGQVYNKKYFRAFLALAADGIAVGNAINQTRKFNEWDRVYREILLNGVSSSGYTTAELSTVSIFRERGRQYKDYAWFSVGVVHLITIIEAFVDRHLLGFDIDEDLTIKLAPNTGLPDSMGIVGLQYNF